MLTLNGEYLDGLLHSLFTYVYIWKLLKFMNQYYLKGKTEFEPN